MKSNWIDLPTAIHEIVTATRRSTSSEHKTFPFFFLMGAGVSAPSIPLASGIERLCREEIASHGQDLPSEGDTPMKRYEACFRQAFPQAEQRRAFLHELVHAAPISPPTFGSRTC